MAEKYSAAALPANHDRRARQIVMPYLAFSRVLVEFCISLNPPESQIDFGPRDAGRRSAKQRSHSLNS